MKISRDLKNTIIFSACIIVIFIICYIVNFSSSNISKDSSNWADFASYFSMLINLASSIAVSVLTIIVYNGQRDRDKWEKDILQLNETPCLIFAHDNNNYNKCYNVGKGAAHKVIIAKKGFDSKDDIIKAYSIPSNGYLEITWRNDPQFLYAYYENFTGKKFLVLCSDDINEQLVNGEDEIKDVKNKEIIVWLKNNAKRHEKIKLRMIGN